MNARVRAGIDLCGTTLRYAEVERYEAAPSSGWAAEGGGESARAGRRGRDASGRHRLLRLGSCDFDFDVTRVLWGARAEQQHVDTLGRALADVYENASAETLRVVVHPPQACSFFAPPMPAQAATEAERRAHFEREARLLMRNGGPTDDGNGHDGNGHDGSGNGGASDEGLHVSVEPPLSDGADASSRARAHALHVLAVSGGAHARFQHVMDALPLPDFRWMVSMEGAARAAVLLEQQRRERARSSKQPAPVSGSAASTAEERAEQDPPDAASPFRLAVGCYPGHLELALARHGRFHFALHAPRAAPSDSAYFAAALLERLGEGRPASAVERVFTYGPDANASLDDDFAALTRLTGTAPEPLDFRPIVGLDPGHLAEDFDPGPYVPCVGAAL
jgi:hypothetical protein